MEGLKMSHPYSGEYHEDKQMEGLRVKHTPGPWNWIEEDWMIRASNGEEVANVEAIMVRERGMDSCLAEQSANATLIAAAPELLEALKSEHTEYIGLKGCIRGKECNTCATIAKAESRA